MQSKCSMVPPQTHPPTVSHNQGTTIETRRECNPEYIPPPPHLPSPFSEPRTTSKYIEARKAQRSTKTFPCTPEEPES